MNDVIIEKVNTYKGYKYQIIFNPYMGFRCGYVQIPENHKLYEIDYPDVWNYGDFGVEFTFGGNLKNQAGFWLGWDHGHYGDGIDMENAVKYLKKLYGEGSTQYMTAMQILTIQDSGMPFATTEDVEEECFEVIEQLQKL